MDRHNEIYTQKIVNLMIRRRKELGISQSELARRAGVPQSTIARIETHKLHIRLDTLMKIMAVLNCDLSFVNNERFETKRLILRKYKIEDAQAMFDGWCSDPEVAKYVTWNPHQNVEETKILLTSWIDQYNNPDAIRYGICLKDSEMLIGSIDVVGYRDGNPEIGYCLSKNHWNHGYMTEALEAMTKHLFLLGFNKIVIAAATDNIASNRVIEKCGFIFTHQEQKELKKASKTNLIIVNWYELIK